MRYVVLQQGKPARWSEKEKEIHRVSIDNELHVNEIRLPKWGKYDLIITVDKEFKTELKENQSEVELLIRKPEITI